MEMLEGLGSVTCSISNFEVRDPVVAQDGHTYERQEIENWLRRSSKSPNTGIDMKCKEVYANQGLRMLQRDVEEFKKEAKRLIKTSEGHLQQTW